MYTSRHVKFVEHVFPFTTYPSPSPSLSTDADTPFFSSSHVVPKSSGPHMSVFSQPSDPPLATLPAPLPPLFPPPLSPTPTLHPSLLFRRPLHPQPPAPRYTIFPLLPLFPAPAHSFLVIPRPYHHSPLLISQLLPTPQKTYNLLASLLNFSASLPRLPMSHPPPSPLHLPPLPSPPNQPVALPLPLHPRSVHPMITRSKNVLLPSPHACQFLCEPTTAIQALKDQIE